jgi:type IV pilus assembly protein PilA
MNIILKQRLAKREHCDGVFLFSFLGKAATHHRKGFTLVEVIVVLVILAILAAIAIPALTGYIDKAEDKKWEMRARDGVVAMRTVLDEEWASGKLEAGLKASSHESYLTLGDTANYNSKIKLWIIENMCYFATGNSLTYGREAAALMGSDQQYPSEAFKKGWPTTYLLAPADYSASFIGAPAFVYRYYPEDVTKSPPSQVVYVTYGLAGVSPDLVNEGQIHGAIWGSGATATCDPDAGYQVYHVAITPSFYPSLP